MIRIDQLCSTAHALQRYTIALQIPRGPPRKSHTAKRKNADSIGLSLTLPKFYLATCHFLASSPISGHLN